MQKCGEGGATQNRFAHRRSRVQAIFPDNERRLWSIEEVPRTLMSRRTRSRFDKEGLVLQSLLQGIMCTTRRSRQTEVVMSSDILARGLQASVDILESASYCAQVGQYRVGRSSARNCIGESIRQKHRRFADRYRAQLVLRVQIMKGIYRCASRCMLREKGVIKGEMWNLARTIGTSGQTMSC